MTDFHTDEDKKEMPERETEKPLQEEINSEPVQEESEQEKSAAFQPEQKEDTPPQDASNKAQPVTPDPRIYGWQEPPRYPPYQGPQPPVQGGPQDPYQGYYGQPPYGGSPYQYPYPYSYQPPVQPGFYGRTPAPKKKMSKGLKAFFTVIGGLFGALLIALIVYSAVAGLHLPVYESPSASSQEPVESTEPSAGSIGEEEEPSKPSYTIEPNLEGIKIEEMPSGDELSAKQIYASISQSVVGISATRENVNGVSQGSGIIATADGYVITNSHVVLNSRNSDVTITLNDETEYKAMVVGCDKTTDLAVIKIVDTTDKFIPASFGDSDALSVGDWVLAIGNPGGSDYASSLTRGIVSAVNRRVGSNSENGMTYIQTDAAINPGNSGGALVNMYGQVIGINSSKIVATGYEGMGFSIPISKAKAIVDELMATGYVQGRTRIGITGTDVSAYMATYQNIPRGFMIQSINEESAFTGTDAQAGDIITAIEGTTVTCLKDISNELSVYKPGDQISVTLYRPASYSSSEKTFDVVITLLEDKGETQE